MILEFSSKPSVTNKYISAGTMGIAILSGILADLESPKFKTPSSSGTSTPLEAPFRLPSRFIACVRRPESAKRIQKALDGYEVKVVKNENVAACKEADVILLGCKPYMVNDILAVDGMKEALEGKLLISICAGVPVSQMETALYGAGEGDKTGCTIVRAMPNTASGIRESMTVVAISTPPLPSQTASLVSWIFKRIGDVVYLPSSNMDASTALCGSGPAFFALMLEAAIDGAVSFCTPIPEPMLARCIS
jgi:pyrroline-5-carboxylate reductase